MNEDTMKDAIRKAESAYWAAKGGLEDMEAEHRLAELWLEREAEDEKEREFTYTKGEHRLAEAEARSGVEDARVAFRGLVLTAFPPGSEVEVADEHLTVRGRVTGISHEGRVVIGREFTADHSRVRLVEEGEAQQRQQEAAEYPFMVYVPFQRRVDASE